MSEMEVLIYSCKRTFDVQKAERYFKERGVKARMIDMRKSPPGPREIRLFADRLGLDALFDRESIAFKESTACYSGSRDAVLDFLAARPELLKAPITRCGRELTLGYCPETWAGWK